MKLTLLILMTIIFNISCFSLVIKPINIFKQRSRNEALSSDKDVEYVYGEDNPEPYTESVDVIDNNSEYQNSDDNQGFSIERPNSIPDSEDFLEPSPIRVNKFRVRHRQHHRPQRTQPEEQEEIKSEIDELKDDYYGNKDLTLLDDENRGYIDPTQNILDPNGILKMRFKSKVPARDMFHTLQPYVSVIKSHFQFYSIDRPEKDSEAVRKEGLSNGIVLEGSMRTCNFETAWFSAYFMDLRHDA